MEISTRDCLGDSFSSFLFPVSGSAVMHVLLKLWRGCILGSKYTRALGNFQVRETIIMVNRTGANLQENCFYIGGLQRQANRI
jgi:hypothetical protein